MFDVWQAEKLTLFLCDVHVFRGVANDRGTKIGTARVIRMSPFLATEFHVSALLFRVLHKVLKCLKTLVRDHGTTVDGCNKTFVGCCENGTETESPDTFGQDSV